jgi:FMN phosphatase YigB (HAD superfamily)
MPKPILFCDFDGVLCDDRYWRSLSVSEFEKIQKLLFQNDTSLVHDWMRGKYTSEEINQIVSHEIGIPYEKLWEVFVTDCLTMQVPKNYLQNLNALRSSYTVLLITGNMDSFNRFTVPELQLDIYFDEIVNSFYEGMNKTDDKGALFLKYADKYDVAISDCVVFDDSPNVCNVFLELGGVSCVVTKDKDLGYYLDRLEGPGK